MTDRHHTDHSETAAAEPDTGEVAGRAVEFYWRPGCPFCMSLKHSLDRAGIAMDALNIWDEPGAAAVVRRATGGSETVPTVGFGGDYLVNPRPAQVLNLIATHNPEWARTLVEEQPPKRRRFRRN